MVFLVGWGVCQKVLFRISWNLDLLRVPVPNCGSHIDIPRLGSIVEGSVPGTVVLLCLVWLHLVWSLLVFPSKNFGSMRAEGTA